MEFIEIHVDILQDKELRRAVIRVDAIQSFYPQSEGEGGALIHFKNSDVFYVKESYSDLLEKLGIDSK